MIPRPAPLARAALLAVGLACLSVAASAHPVSVPMGRDEAGHSTATVKIQGHGPYPFLVDTAAQATALSPGLVDELKISPDTATQAVAHGASGSGAVTAYRLDDFEVAGVRRDGMLAVSAPGHEAAPATRGIIGADVFKGSRLEFDYVRGLMSVDTAPGRTRPAGFKAVSAQLLAGVFVLVPVRVGGVEAVALVDTGARHTVANPKLMAALGFAEGDPRLTASEGHGGFTGQSARVLSGASLPVLLGETRFPPLPLRFSDFHVFGALGLADRPALILGSDFWNGLAALAIDYDASEIQIRTR